MVRTSSPHRRVHVVLVPGFAGFDALGQLEYYAGVTPQFAAWKLAGGQPREHVVLHYFDNFPTAAVATRATRLRAYLAKRIARGEFLPGDSLALVGHSTGGLDIRYLLWELALSPDKSYPADGMTVPAKTILESVSRVVFLSVPQWGTNIANWVREHAAGRALVVAELRASVVASQVPLADKIQEWISYTAGAATKVNFVYALQDAFDEAEAPYLPGPGTHRTGARGSVGYGAMATPHRNGFQRHRRPLQSTFRRRGHEPGAL